MPQPVALFSCYLAKLSAFSPFEKDFSLPYDLLLLLTELFHIIDMFREACQPFLQTDLI